MDRMRAILRIGVAVCAALLIASILQAGQPQLTIMRAEADQPPDLAAGKILIQGYNFVPGNETNVVVTLAGETLLIIGIPTGTEIVAELPAGYPPGTYLLTVSRGSGSVKNDTFDLTIGAVGPAGSKGDKGDKGDKGQQGEQGLPGSTGPRIVTGGMAGQLTGCSSLEGAQVFVPGRSFGAITPASGEFRIDFVPPGSYDVAYQKGGRYTLLKDGVVVTEQQDTSLGVLQTTDLETDVTNCGHCGTICQSPPANAERVCIAGTCGFSCIAPFTRCGQTCADLWSDHDNCGACGAVCLFGATCEAGACELTCPAPLTKCGQTCVNLSSDHDNCGACGTACGDFTECDGGICRPPRGM